MIRRAFTLIEMLVVIAITSGLISILIPALNRAREQAQIVVVNSDLRQISLALTMYHDDHKKYPPTREDCNTGLLGDHLYQLPTQLADGHYLPRASRFEAMTTPIEDPFNRGRTYKYRAPGECIRDRNIIHRRIRSRVWAPNGFPGASSIDSEEGQWYDSQDDTPVQWVLFSVGPRFDQDWVHNEFSNRFPVPYESWYNLRQKKGFIVRLRLNNGSEIGSFQGHP